VLQELLGSPLKLVVAGSSNKTKYFNQKQGRGDVKKIQPCFCFVHSLNSFIVLINQQTIHSNFTTMKYSFYLFSFISLMAYSQKENSQWYFGNKAALDFLSGAPLSANGSSMASVEGCVSMADTSGNLLFYSNGATVWNKNHAIMDNGSGLMGNQSTTQSSFVVKKPGANTNIYYLFSLGQLGTGSLGYSIIDMSLAAGLGSVTTKNDTLAENMTEKLHGALHCNGKDIWVVGHKYNSNEFYAYLMSAAGINTVPVISSVGALHGVSNGTLNGSAGAMKISPNGKKIGIGSTLSQITEILDFNPANGQVSNGVVISTSIQPYGCEFSADGSKFYVTELNTTNYQLHQWDLCAGSASAIINSHQIIASLSSTVGGFGSMQLAPDGKIYIAAFQATFVSVINNPNTSGSGCNFTQQGVSIAPNNSIRGLPNHISSSHRLKALINTAITGSCGAVSFSYTSPAVCTMAGDSVTSVEWQFNDSGSSTANTSSVTNPQYSYSQNGTYTVNLIVHYNCYTDTLKQVVSISNLPNLTVSGKQTICNGEKLTLSLSGAGSYSVNGVSSTNNYTAQPAANTIYTISAAGAVTNACIAKKTISLTVLPCANISHGNKQSRTIRIYPNPSNGAFTVETEFNAEISITDISGRLVYIKSLNSGKHSLDLSEQARGIYFMKAKDINQFVVFKLIKE
jgi:hypothetical protein